jgi:4-hydroxy-3-polyprenylbenzoate decarboxylase
MGLRTLSETVAFLRRENDLVEIEQEIDPNLVAAAIVRRVNEVGGPAVLFRRVRGSRYPMLGNLFGTLPRARRLFADTLEGVSALVDARVDPRRFLGAPTRALRLPSAALHLLPRTVRRAPVLDDAISIGAMPQVVGWPRDAGAFITLPQVYSESPDAPGFAKSNLGMYRVQLSGGRYRPGEQVGLHYQLHRGIGVHHQRAIARREPLRVNVFVGGPPAMTVAAVMPLPEGLPELSFAGALMGERLPVYHPVGRPLISAEADFCIQGVIEDGLTLPEGPFGDHLGYYSLTHEFPVLRVERVTARRDAIWPFTSVGRPPQEDTTFGAFIHELTGPLVPQVLPGVRALHAVDAAGVHPLLLAIGSERYVPYRPTTEPAELLTQASAILGTGQTSLAKWLWIVDGNGAGDLDVHDVRAFFEHALARLDWSRDLHFHTRTTIDTLDYSGHGFNRGSKLVLAAAGPAIRSLATSLPSGMRLPAALAAPTLAMPGVLVVSAPRHDAAQASAERAQWLAELGGGALEGIALVVLVDDAKACATRLRDFLWATFTRADPARDVDGVGAFIVDKHWGCRGPLVIDARIKAHHAPPLEDDPTVMRAVDALAARGGPLAGIL